jgi:type I restriction enzyme S subunit
VTPAPTLSANSNGEDVALPHGWQGTKLKDICELNPRRPSLNRDDDTPTTFVPMPAVAEAGVGITRPELRPYSAIRKGYTYFAEGDVLFAKITPCMENGKHAIARSLADGIGFGSTEFHVLRPGPRVVAEWLHYFVMQPWVLQQATAHFTGSVGQQRVPEDYLADLDIPLPPLPEQRRITVRLSEQLDTIAAARAAVQAQINAAQALPAAHLRSVFSNSVASDWPRQAVADVCQLLPSKSIALSGDTEVRAITSACLTETGFNPAGVKTARMWKADAQESVVQPGEILIARSNTPDLVGRVSIYTGGPQGVVASDLTIRLWPGAEIRSEFLVGYLSYLYTSGYWRERAGGASGTMKKITRSQIEAERVPVPSASVQESVAGRLKAELATALGIARLIEERLTALDHLPAALLRDAFAGRV